MPYANNASVPTRSRRLPGLPTLGGPAMVAFGLTLGTLLVLFTGSFSWLFTALFALGAFAAVLTVNVRGLFITAASIPVLFGVFSLLAGWSVSSGSSFAGTSAFSSATLVAGAYPLIEGFPSLLVMTALSTFIAVMRVWLWRRTYSRPVVRKERVKLSQPQPGHRAMDAHQPGKSRLTVAEIAARNRRSPTRPVEAPGMRSPRRPRMTREEYERARAAARAQRRRVSEAERRRIPPAPQRRAGHFAPPPPPSPRPPSPRRHRRLDDDLY